MQIHTFRCFGEHADGGNSALVIEDDRSSTEARQAFARHHNVTCVWIDPCDEPGVAAVVDYFYPHMRSPLCLHATLAVGQQLFLQLFSHHGRQQELAVMTAVRGQRLGLAAGDNGEVLVRLQVQDAPQLDVDPRLIQRLLAAPELAPQTQARVVSVGSPKLLVEVANTAALYALQPDLAAIAAWGKDAGVNGLYVYCRCDDGTYEGRNFHHLDPALEDSATGVAAGALTAMLGCGITLRQGRVVGSANLIRTRTDGPDILVGGRVQAG